MLATIFDFCISIIIGALFLFIGDKVAGWLFGGSKGGTYFKPAELLISSLVAAVASIVPYIGWLLSIIALFYILHKYSRANTAELLTIVFISRAAVVAVNMLLIPIVFLSA